MKFLAASRLALRLSVVALFVGLCVSRGETQNPNLSPTFGTVTLRAGFVPDPYTVRVVAGGNIRTNLGGINQSVANAPDYRLNYVAGNLPLTFYVRSAADTTLLVNLPNGTWVANDDGDGNLNPVIKIQRPMSGQYDIWVGTFNQGNPQATLYITELR
jgi:hypothetical protein